MRGTRTSDVKSFTTLWLTLLSVGLVIAGAARAEVRDIWAGKDLGVSNDGFTAKVPRHGAAMVRVKDSR